MICVLILTLLLVYILYRVQKNVHLPPGPLNLPVVGSLLYLDPKQPHLTLTKWAKKYGPVFGMNLGSVYTVVLTDPKTIKSVFSKDVTTCRAPLYVTHGIMKGYGIVCSEGDLWKDQRKFIYNSLRQFGAAKISENKEKMEELIMENVLDFINHIKEMGLEVYIEPLEPLRHNIGSIMNQIVFGHSWSREDETWNWLQNLQEEGIKLIGVAGPLNFLPFLRYIPMFKRTMDFLISGKLKTHKLYQDLIKKQCENIISEDYNNLIQAFIIEKEKRKDTKDIEKFYNDQQFYHLLADIFGAGLDTTLTTLRWYLLFMATNPQHQDILRQQIEEEVGNRLVKLSDIHSLPWLEASIAETQRIRSVVPLGIPHGTQEEFKIGKYKIPKQTMIVPLQWAVHMNEEVYENPNEFNPKRFLSKQGQFIKNPNFIPFQTGKRMCIGDEFARMILYLFGSNIIQNFRLTVKDKESVDLTGECGITLNPKHQKILFQKLF
ncbi:unnamed protein product [Brassicogethes aeneus]|nr:unnamed protein product [Brassicogethes aeneus]